MASVSLAMKSSEVVAELKQEQEQEQEQEEQHFHVLAVDDSLLDRKLLERLLRCSSYQVTCVDSGDEALKYLGLVDELNQNSPTSSSSIAPSSELEATKVINLIMTDYCMPGMSGYDLLKRVKGSSWKDVPVVVMSSENVPSRISRCLEGGAEEFLLKPLQLSDLKKLHPYLLKSLHHYPSDSNSNNVMEANIEVGDIDQVHQSKSSSETVVKDDSTNNNNIVSIMSKRKAVSAQTITQRRPKMKGLAVV